MITKNPLNSFFLYFSPFFSKNRSIENFYKKKYVDKKKIVKYIFSLECSSYNLKKGTRSPDFFSKKFFEI